MRDLINITHALFEGAIPPDRYGYWIMPDGRIIPAAVQAHVVSALEQLGLDWDQEDMDDDPEGEKNFSVRQQAVEEGGIRVVWERGQTGLTIQASDPPPPAVKSLLRLISENRGVSLFRIQVDHQYEEFDNSAAAVRALRKWFM